MTDGQQYTALLLRHKKLIWKLCRKYSRHDVDRCHDLVQEVSIALWEHYGRLNPEARPWEQKHWVWHTTRLVLRNIHRGKKDDELLLDNSLFSLMADNSHVERDMVKELLETLPEQNRELMQMRLDGYTTDEIAEKMHLTRDAVYQRISRTIKKLKQINDEQR